MALITCPDCANQYSDDAPYCPNCGRPNPARQAGNAGSTGSPPGGASETPASTGPSNTYSPGTGSTGPTGQAGSSGGYTGGGTAGGGTGGYTGATETPAGGGYGGSTGSSYGGTGGTGGYGGTGGTGGTGGYGGGTGGTGGTGGYGGGGYTPGASPPQQVPNYLVASILVTLFTCFTCCIPIGAVALYFSTQVNSKLGTGDVAGAWEASKNAKRWCIITAIIGAAWLVIGVAFGILGSILSAVANQTG